MVPPSLSNFPPQKNNCQFGSGAAQVSRMKTWPHSLHSFKAALGVVKDVMCGKATKVPQVHAVGFHGSKSKGDKIWAIE